MFNSAQNCQVNLSILDKLPSKLTLEWLSFSNKEVKSTINKWNDSSTPRLYCISWKHFKAITKDKRYIINIINIANIYINIGHWPSHFKISLSIIITKLNKVTYNFLKVFHPIILLNTLGKLIKEVISERLQFQSISNNFIYPNQLGGLKQWWTMDTSIFLTYYQTYKAWTLASLFNISFLFSFDLFFHFELRVGISSDITIILSHISHIRWYSHNNGHENIEGPRRIML